MADYKFITWLVIAFSMNMMFWFAQNGIDEVSANTQTIFTFEGSPASTLISNASSDHPSFNKGKEDVPFITSDSVDADTGNFFTDGIKSINNWFNELDTKMSVVSGIFRQPYGFLMDAGIPPAIASAFGVIWYVIGIMLFVGFIRGGNQ